MTSSSENRPTEAYVWIWLPGTADPVVAGVLHQRGDLISFNYGQSYLGREDAIPIYLPELPLRAGRVDPPGGLSIHGCINDATPDAWGQRVIMRRLIGKGTDSTVPAALGPLTYMLHSGSERIGALDFQASPDTYRARTEGAASLEDLMEAAELLERGLPLPADLDLALLHGSSVGGARPKALVGDAGERSIAKFSSSTDRYPVVKAECVAMELAQRAGLAAAGVELVGVLGRDVLLVERFDRELTGGVEHRRSVVSALTMLGLDELLARYASYADLAEIVRARFTDPAATLRELFARISFNILAGNTDDHARNHAAFWDGEMLELAPAYDICPQPRSGGEASQAMAIGANGFRMSRLAGCVDAASTYLLGEAEAREIIDHQIEVIESEWSEVCELAQLGEADRSYFWGRQFLNPYALEGYRRG